MDASIKLFKALSDKTRLRIMAALLRSGKELCICELMDTLDLAQYNISRHIKELKTAGLVRERKEGRFVFYSLLPSKDPVRAQVIKALGLMERDSDTDDRKRLKKRLALRKGGKCVVGMKKCCSQ